MKNKKDSLGDRMKNFYENRTRSFLPRRTYTIIRIDGKAFHTYTRGLKRPFDDGLINDMDETASYLCKNIQGAKLAFVQSDEISIILTDFDAITTDAWFDGNIQKIVSIASSMATAKFNQLRLIRQVLGYGIDANKILDGGNSIGINKIENIRLAEFDARVFTIPSKIEVLNYLIWRQEDTVRNSIQSSAQNLYSHKELENKNCSELQEMCFQKGVNWNDYPIKYKRGRLITKHTYLKDNVERSKWISIEPPTFTVDNEIITSLIPS